MTAPSGRSLPFSVASTAPRPAASIRRARASGTPTAPESEVRAERELAVRTSLSPAPATMLATTPVIARRAGLRERSPAALVVVEEEIVVAPAANAETERVMRHAALALEFADLDEDEDRIWIDLDEVLGPSPHEARELPALLVLEESEPVAFFAEVSDPGPVRPESVLAAGPRASIIEEQTKPVPPPDE